MIEPLSERELEVLQLIAEGLTNREIASRLFLSLNTVKAHTRNIYGKLGVHSRTLAVAMAKALGVLTSNRSHDIETPNLGRPAQGGLPFLFPTGPLQ